MLGFLRRNTKDLKTDPIITRKTPIDNAPYIDAQTDRQQRKVRRDMRQAVQLLLHRQRLFPSEIGTMGDWSEVTFYVSNPQYKQAATTLRALQRQGAIIVDEPLQWHGYNGWTARVRVND